MIRHRYRRAPIPGCSWFQNSLPAISMELNFSMKSCPWVLRTQPPSQASWWPQSLSPHSLPGLANKNPQCSIKYEFQIKTKYLFSLSVSHAIFRTHLHCKSVCCLSENIWKDFIWKVCSWGCCQHDITQVSLVRSELEIKHPSPGQVLQNHSVPFRGCLGLLHPPHQS